MTQRGTRSPVPIRRIARPIGRPLKRLNERLGRRIFGNTNTLSLNLKGAWHIARCRLASGRIKTRPTSLDAGRLKTNGYVRLPERLDPATMADIRAAFEVLIEKPEYHEANEKYGRDRTDIHWSIPNAHLRIPAIARVLSSNLRAALEQYYKAYFAVVQVVAYRNYAVPAEIAEGEIYSSNWHCDARRPSLLKLMLNISDVTGQDGPFHVVSRQRTRTLLTMGFKNRHGYGLPDDVMEDPQHVVKLVGPSGTGMLCCTYRCLHRAGIPAPGRHRDLLRMVFVPSARPLADDWVNLPVTGHRQWVR